MSDSEREALEDPVIIEIREARRKIWEECNRDWRRYYLRIKDREDRRTGRPSMKSLD